MHDTRQKRVVLELPGAMEEAAVWNAVGFELDAPTREVLNDGLVRLTWQQDGIPPLEYESGMPAPWVVGPAFKFSSSPDWSVLGEWYSGLLNEHESGDAGELGKAAREWAGDAKTSARNCRKSLQQSRQRHSIHGPRIRAGRFSTAERRRRSMKRAMVTAKTSPTSCEYYSVRTASIRGLRC